MTRVTFCRLLGSSEVPGSVPYFGAPVFKVVAQFLSRLLRGVLFLNPFELTDLNTARVF